jgi:hypothetical protein
MKKKELSYETRSITPNFTKTVYPVFHNFSFSKINLTFDDSERESHNLPTISTYSYNQMTQEYFSKDYAKSAYNNLTFSYTNMVDDYIVRTPKIHELFGIVGGIIGFFIFGIGCFVGSFNDYRMKYLIGRELYRFEKLRK